MAPQRQAKEPAPIGERPRAVRAWIPPIVFALVSLTACSKPHREQVGDASAEQGEEAGPTRPTGSAFEPPELPNVPLDGASGGLTLFASTLRQGESGLELYAGTRNEGQVPLCGAAMQLEFYDHADQLIGTASASVQSGRLYALPDSSTTISCVAPGQTAMVAVVALPDELLLDDLQYIGHRFPLFVIDGATPVPSVTVSDVVVLDVAGGSAFRGTVTNASDVSLSEPSVSVFPVNDVGRPLGAATSTATVEIPPGATWSFETGPVADPGVDQLAFAVVGLRASQ